MNAEDIMRELNDIDQELIEEAAPKGNRRPWLRWASAAACVAAVLIGILAFAPREKNGSDSVTVSLGGVIRQYKGFLTQENALLFPWEYQTAAEQYTVMLLDGQEYRGRCRPIDETLLGQTLGTCEAYGGDIYTQQEYRENFETRSIAGMDDALLAAVKLDEKYYVFMKDDYDPPLTLGAFIDGYDLTNTLELTRFAVFRGYTTQGNYAMEEASDGSAAIWGILASCREAAFAEYDSIDLSGTDYISFTATSESLGIWKKVFYVTADGYVRTNIIEWGYSYFIGEEAAKKIIDYAMEHSVAAEFEPYSYQLAGTITEIGDDYILIDDSIIAADPEDGMVFKVPTEDIRVSRWLDFAGYGIGDFVAVQYTGGIDVEAGNIVLDAYSLSAAIIHDGEVLIPE